MRLLGRKKKYSILLRSFERWMSEEEGDACATGAGTTNYTRRPSPARPSPAAGHSFPFRFLCVCRSHSLRGRANKSNKRVGGAVTGDTTYDVNLPAPPPFPSNLRFIGLLRHDPPETRFVNSLVETRLTPGPASRPADQLHRVHLCLPLTCFRAIPRVLSKYRFPGSEGGIENVGTWNLHRASSLVTLAR